MNKALYVMCLTVYFLSACRSTPKDISFDQDLLKKVRQAASVIPGALPTRINYLKFGETVRKWSDVVEGGSAQPFVLARTAFQVVYPDGWMMVDAGMDKEISKLLNEGKEERFDEARAAVVREAVSKAKMIVVTNEKGDHVGGVIRTGNADSVPNKTLLTKEQVEQLEQNPGMAEIRLKEGRRKDYLMVDLVNILPVAPGIVVIKAPGFTKGETMIYARLQNGQEFLFTGDVSWSLKGIGDNKQRPDAESKSLKEDRDQVAAELAWLNTVFRDKHVTLLVSHDDATLSQLASSNTIGNNLETGMLR
jgi:glyoxylase-like metal-dependent hydrolase (beta-lactamase superfamily II)